MKSTIQTPDLSINPTSAKARAAWSTGLTVIATAAAASAAIWLIARFAFNANLMVAFGGQPSQSVDLFKSILTPVVAGLLAMVLLVALARLIDRGVAIWTAIASGVLLLSFSGPLTADASGETKIALVALHLVVGVILIAGLPRMIRSKAP